MRRGTDDPLARVLAGAAQGRKTKGRTRQYEKPGGFGEALGDYEALRPRTIRQIPDGSRVGDRPDGSTRMIVRPRSSDGRATLEIQRGRTRIKIRYGDRL